MLRWIAVVTAQIIDNLLFPPPALGLPEALSDDHLEEAQQWLA